MKTQQKKSAILGRIVESLGTFYPALAQHFMCPTCLEVYRVSDRQKMSVAHVVPRAADGSLKTYICTNCNSKFGANQDRWFGDFLQLRHALRQRREATILDAPSQPGYFSIDGTRVQGTYSTESDGSLGFFIDTNKTSPKALRQVLSRPPKSITVPIPLLGKQQLVDVGFLTAAYLLWFKELGYSWALQAHLAQVRQQIQEPTERIIDSRFWVTCQGHYFERPWVGVASIRDELVLIAALADRIVLLPPADRKNFYLILDEEFTGLTSFYHQLRFADGHRFGPPVGVLYRDRLLISPDILLKEPRKAAYILYPPGKESNPRVLLPIDEAEFRRQQTLPNHQLIKVGGQIEIQAVGTGEPKGT